MKSFPRQFVVIVMVEDVVRDKVDVVGKRKSKREGAKGGGLYG